jgi:anhydro-N-acetylmuramic acid kinase
MAGTSRDGIDVAVVEISGRFPLNRIELLHTETFPYPPWLVTELGTSPEEIDAEKLSTLDFLLGELFGRSVLLTLEAAGLRPDEIDVIGSHGQTLLHRPKGVRIKTDLVRSTLQIGSGAAIARITGIDTISDFRSADITVGGEGAPLVPVFDFAVLRSRTRSRVALNVGGIANLTAIPAGAGLCDIWSFDTGPGNCMIDTAVQILTHDERRFDGDGKMAREGKVDGRTYDEIVSHPYLKRKPPKSTGWNEFGRAYTEKAVWKMLSRGLPAVDVVRTLTDATAETIWGAIKDFVLPRMDVDDMVVTGGGNHNPVLMEGLALRLPRVALDAGEAFGIDSDAKEAMAFGYLAYLFLRGIPGNIISQTQNLPPAVLGALYPASGLWRSNLTTFPPGPVTEPSPLG